MPSAAVCVLTERRWVCASRRATTTSTGSKRASIHGAISVTGPGASPFGNNRLLTIVCIHVVPHFGGVHTKISPGREVKYSHRRLSETTVRYSRSILRSTGAFVMGAPSNLLYVETIGHLSIQGSAMNCGQCLLVGC